MNILSQYKDRFETLQAMGQDNHLKTIRQQAFSTLNALGIPSAKHEEWKYTRIAGLFNKEYHTPKADQSGDRLLNAFNAKVLPGHENANIMVFVNGFYSPEYSHIKSASLYVEPLEIAITTEHGNWIRENVGLSSGYLHDGINALNAAFIDGAVFIQVKKAAVVEHPVYVYHLSDASAANVFSQPRTLILVGSNAQVQFVETYITIGASDSFTNQVMEMIIEKDAMVEYYKIQNDVVNASLVSTTHFQQVGKSYLHTATISLNGAIVRNNLNVVLGAEKCEAHLYGLYFQKGETHIDNHTVVDNVMPNAYSNELYKGVLDDRSTGVFNGKIFVRPLAQKTNAYQSNKNILLSETANINSKPQLEIFADDVKCSHGCTIGLLDQDALFYLRSRGIPAKIAQSLLVSAFANDILEHIKLVPIHDYVERLISEQLEFEKA